MKRGIKEVRWALKKGIILLLAFVASGLSQTVKINELMYAPKNGEPEWVELYNNTLDSINIRNWKIRNKNAKWYTITGANFYIFPDSYLVITKSDTIFSFHQEIPSPVLICPALPSTFMVNTGDTISIHDSTDAVVDSVFYEPSWGGSDGKSLERISTDVSPFLSANWGTSLDPTGSTPGKKNSIAARQYDLKITYFSAVLSSSDSTLNFRINVKNSGSRSISSFEAEVFLDYNGDFLPQPGELVGTSDKIQGLNAGDSIQIVLPKVPIAGITSRNNLSTVNAIAYIEFAPDQDTTDNIMWSRLQVSYSTKSLVVNEIMYAPRSPEPEWVELYNTSNNSVNLNGFTLADNSGTKAIITSDDYLFPSNDYVVIAHDTAIFNIYRGIRGKVLITKIPSLNNAGDVVAIHDACGGMIDSVNYASSWGGNSGGKSLERILPAGDSNDPQNFETSMDSSGGTPARINSVTPRDYDLAIGTISYSPSPVRSGERITISTSVINNGLKSSGPATIVFFIDKNGNGICDIGEPLDSAKGSPMIPGDSIIVNFTSCKLSSGTFHFGIFINYPEDEVQSNNTRACAVNVGLPHASIVINEIMYAPKSPEQEWLEFYNTSDTLIDLSNFKIGTHGGSIKIVNGSLIAPEDFVIICKDSSVSKLHHPVKNFVEQGVPSLSNNGDCVTIYDNLGNLLDSVNYVPSYGGSNGKSLERIDYFAVDDSTNWHESFDSTGATPGMVNSVAMLPYDVSLKRLDCATSFDVGQRGNINLIIQNVGRNEMCDIDASIEIMSCIDGKTILLDEQPLNLTLTPGDSVMLNFVFTPTQPGAYRILAKISEPQDRRQWNDTLSTLINVCYQANDVVINEIMYSSGKMGEYFEIYNTSQNAIDLSDWTFRTSSTQTNPFYLAALKNILSPNDYFVVAADSSIFGFMQDTGMVQIVKSMTLRDDGGYVILSDPSRILVDSIDYQPAWHNGDIANTSGRSLEKINPIPSVK